MIIRLRTNKDIKAYCQQYHGKWTKCTENSEYFGSYTTYYDNNNIPILQHDIDNRTGKITVLGLLDYPPAETRKVLDFSKV